jgi:hypothetical protein
MARTQFIRGLTRGWANAIDAKRWSAIERYRPARTQGIGTNLLSIWARS